jgi:uncharacterized membrane protein
MKKLILTNLKAVVIALALVAGGLSLGSAHAASGGLTISPTSFDQEIAPGSSKSGEMLVINQGELDLNYKVYATPYSVNGEDYKPYFQPIKGAIDISKWFKIDNTGGPLPIGQQDTIPFTITVPKGIGAGSYYATLFAETDDKGSSGVVTRKRVGSVVYIRVAGKAIEKGSVDSWKVPILQQDPLHATLKIANTGSIHFQSDVKITVKDVFGGTKFTYERTPKIIPQKIRDIPVQWDDGAKFGLFKIGGEVKYFNTTETLPTKYVFIANTPMRLITGAMLLAVIAALVFVGVKRVARKK